MHVSRLLQHVARGEEAAVAAMLAANPVVGLATVSAFTDPAGRCFEGGISGWQYALWSLDLHLWRVMLRAFEGLGGETLARARAQLLTVSAAVLPWQREHGRVFDFAPILRAYEMYDRWEGVWGSARRFRHWSTVIGRAQRRAPAHVLQEFCRRDRPLAPPPDFSAPEPLHPAATAAADALPAEEATGERAGEQARGGSPPQPQPPPPSVTPAAGFDCRYERRVTPLPPAAAATPPEGAATGSGRTAAPSRPEPADSPAADASLELETRRVSLPRERLDWLLTEQHDGGGLGETFALIRGHGDLELVTPSSWRAQVAIAGTHDAVALRSLAAARTAQFEHLVSFHSPDAVRMRGERLGAGGALGLRVGGGCHGRGDVEATDGGRRTKFVMHTPRKTGIAASSPKDAGGGGSGGVGAGGCGGGKEELRPPVMQSHS